MNLSGLAGFASGFANTRGAIEDRKKQDEMIAAMQRPMGLPNPTGMPMGDASGMGTGGGMGTPTRGAGGIGANPTLLDLIDTTEGGGSYDTLYGHSQRGGKFNGVDVTQMKLSDIYSFADPKGAYGQWVAQNNNGTVATPMGRYQIVGTTLKGAAAEMGLSPDTLFTPQTQDAIAAHLAYRRVSSASTPAAKRAAMRAEWAGFRNVTDSALDTAIANFEANGGQLTPRPMGLGPQ